MYLKGQGAISLCFALPLALFGIVHGFTSRPISHTFTDRKYDRIIGQPHVEQHNIVFGQVGVTIYSKAKDGLDDDEPNLTSTIIGSKKSITQRLELKSRFDRWAFLQRILEGELDVEDTNQIVFQILKSNLYESTSSLDALQQEKNAKLADSLFRCNENGDGVVMALVYADDNNKTVTVGSERVWAGLETILPHPTDEEDAYKCGWDLIIELYGREATKMSQKSGDPLWKANADIVRLLIHLDFLSDGIMEDPFC